MDHSGQVDLVFVHISYEHLVFKNVHLWQNNWSRFCDETFYSISATQYVALRTYQHSQTCSVPPIITPLSLNASTIS